MGLAGLDSASGQTLTTRRVNTSGLSRPLYAVHAPGDFQRLFVVEQHTGRIRIMDLKTGEVSSTPFLTIGGLSTRGEQGLLGLAFHPDYQTNGRFYVNLTVADGQTQVREYTATSANVADPNTGRTLFSIDQPFTNHNGGWMSFGPNDGYLYIATGDGGDRGDPGNRAQNLSIPLGKMLRIDVDGDNAGAYGVPVDNPFYEPDAEQHQLTEAIWAYGLRNPWRNSFDRATGDLYIADVGQGEVEEVNFQPVSHTGGANYGWRVMEGFECFDGTQAGGNPPCGAAIFTNPIHTYEHEAPPDGGFSITGGYVYRGPVTDLRGTYFFADYVSEQIWSLRYDGENVTGLGNRTSELAPTVGSQTINQIASFGEDAGGGLYIVDLGGEIFEIVPRVSTVTGQFLSYDGAPLGSANQPLIAPDKIALLPGDGSSLENYSTYARGLNGVVVDLDHLAGPNTLTLDDFSFRAGTTSDLNQWETAADPTNLQVLLNQGREGADRIWLSWEDHAIENTWLEVTVLATEHTGLAEPATFYFGHALGDTGDNELDVIVDLEDFERIVDGAADFLEPAGLDNLLDLNRDGLIDGTDAAVARDAAAGPQPVLPMIQIPLPSAPAQLATVPEPGGLSAAALGLVGLVLASRRRAAVFTAVAS